MFSLTLFSIVLSSCRLYDCGWKLHETCRSSSADSLRPKLFPPFSGHAWTSSSLKTPVEPVTSGSRSPSASYHGHCGHSIRSMYIIMYIYTYLHLHIYIYIFTYTYTYIYIYIFTYTYIYIYTYLHIYIHIYIYIIYTYVFVYIYIYMWHNYVLKWTFRACRVGHQFPGGSGIATLIYTQTTCAMYLWPSTPHRRKKVDRYVNR